MKKHSTGALTDEQKAEQDRRYLARSSAADGEYDFLFIGMGNASLTCASLLANAGYKVCMLEAHDRPGGYLHTFTMSGYHFCAQVHYIWGCGEGGTINQFLKRIGLEQEIQFNLLDPEGYDQMVMPDGKRVKIAYGWDSVKRNIERAYPDSTGLDEFFGIISAVRREAESLPRKIRWWDVVLKGMLFPNIIRLRNKSLQDLFDLCGVSKEAQTVLSAQAGDFLLPPRKLSALYYIALLGGYGSGAYHADPGFEDYVNRLAGFLEDHGSDLYFEEKVTGITALNKKITGVATDSGKVFAAKNYICGMDPRSATALIGRQHFSRRYQRKLDYEYSGSGVVVYLGLKPGFDPARYGLGNHNTWHCFDWDMNDMWTAGDRLDIEKAWLFVSTPTMHSSRQPNPGHVIELATYVPYAPFRQAQDNEYREYQRLKMGVADKMIGLLEQHHVPDLKQHIAVKVVGSPTTNQDFCGAPFGNAYGAALLADQTTSRLGAETPFANLYWCNASSGSPSICGTVATGVNLYMDLTGDEFIQTISDEEMIAMLPASL